MSAPQLERTTSAKRRRVAPDGMTAAEPAAPTASGRLYRVVWRWHFYAGMIVSPVLMVLAATGALYIFKDELEAVFYSRLMFVSPAAERVSYEAQVATVRAAVPQTFHLSQLEIHADPARATGISMSDGATFQTAYVDPYNGQFLGTMGPGGFFSVVLKIHRQLFVGTTGRIVVELVTCWTIVLLVTGAYLWWPRRGNQLWGAWLPRLRRHPYVALRDLHAVGGAYVAVIALTMAGTGLLYTYVWGSGYQLAALKTNAYEIFTNPPQNTSPPEAPSLAIDRIVEIAQQKMPGYTLSVTLPRIPNGAYVVFASGERGPTVHELSVIDRASGEILHHRFNRQAKTLAWWGTWNYPLHVGSILGLPTKIIWLATCLMLMTLPVTGMLMWWQRRPQGKLGLPRRVEVRLPRWLAATITALCIVLPMMGISVIVLLVGELMVSRIRRVVAA
jgi:uncharacterized iron-regulated membrane protein